LALFNAETEEEIKKLKVIEMPVMKQAIEAYRSITASSEFRENERLRFHDRPHRLCKPGMKYSG